EGFTEQAEELRRTEVRKATAIARFDMFMFMLPELALGIALLVGLHLTADGTISTGQLASYFATATLVVGPVRMLGMLLGQARSEGFTEQAEELRRTEVRKATAIARFDMFMFMLPELALGIALLVGLHLTADGTISTGQLASYFATATLVVGPVRMLGMLLGQAVNATTALDRHYEVMDSENTITSSESSTHVDPSAATGAVRLDDVHFR